MPDLGWQMSAPPFELVGEARMINDGHELLRVQDPHLWVGGHWTMLAKLSRLLPCERWEVLRTGLNYCDGIPSLSICGKKGMKGGRDIQMKEQVPQSTLRIPLNI